MRSCRGHLPAAGGTGAPAALRRTGEENRADKGDSELQLHFSTRSNEELAWDLYGNSGVVPPFGSCPFIAVTSELQGS
ncbi:hypothetical protein DUI87_28307 [Hirundo rustica rustica]|uniref:Uncharacterized protein n=1 Tax=Hirundo rustica rustica TaxID=333673 RepID=A0A3M0J4Q5_HIRRU|nr:hypothetical protein DUI87_28307 [Hirundo rustica rustica]